MWKLSTVHGLLGGAAYGLLLPASIVIARSCKDRRGRWFTLHWVFLLVAYALGMAAVIMGTWLRDNTSLKHSHKVVGGVTTGLGGVQILAAFGLRPGLLSSMRPLWNVMHWWTGRSTLLLGVATLLSGLAAKHRRHPWDAVPWYAALASILAMCYMITALKDTKDYLCKPRLDAETRLELGLKSNTVEQQSPLLAARYIPGHGYFSPQPLLQTSSAS